MSKHIYFLVFFLLTLLFLGTRFYKIQESFLFFNDMGRDALVLLDWQRSWKPPLLGPQTSALPFNQSAVYFYLLFPFFLLTGGSAYSALITNALLYIVVLAGVWWAVRSEAFWRTAVVGLFWLIIIHPQFILQNKLVWNPSFVPLCVLAAFVSFCFLQKEFSRKHLFIFCLSSALAVALNYSVIPSIVGLIVASFFIFQNRKKVLWLILGTGVMFLLLNLPMIVFEVRHRFVLSSQLFTSTRPDQGRSSFADKTHDLILHSFNLSDQSSNVLLSMLFFIFLIVGIWQYQNETSTETSEKKQLFFLAYFLFSFTVVSTVLSPVTLHSHYVFGVLMTAFFCLVFLPSRLSVLALAVYSLVWLVPLFQGQYHRPVTRTVSQMNACFAQVCAEEKQPLFVTNQASWHVFHNAPEHRFLMSKNGCNVRNIATEPTVAQHMAVVVEDSAYQHGKTAYHELTQFGASTPKKTYQCSATQGNFDVVILEKK